MARKSARTVRPDAPPERGSRPLNPALALLGVVLLLTAAVGLLYPELAFQGKVFFAGDNQAAASFSAVGKQQLQAGSYPVWNPYVFGGMPSFGSLAYTPYIYPLNPVIGILVRFLFFPDYSWFLVHAFLAGLGTFLLTRSRGADPLIALTAGVFMIWMPNLVAVGANGHGSQACAVAYLPFALWFWDRLWRGRGIVVNGAALALTLGLSMLRGHLQISYYTYALVIVHALFFGIARLIDASRGRGGEESLLPGWLRARVAGAGPLPRAATEVGAAFAVLAVVVAVSLAMSAVLYLPVHDYAQYSTRGASSAGGLDYNYATAWSLHPSEMITFLVPHAFGFGKELYLGHMPFTDYPNYLGLVVSAFAVLALFARRDRWTVFLATVWVVTTLVSFGRFLPVLYDPLFKLVPYFSKFRVPVMVLIVQQLVSVALFAVGAAALLAVPRERARKIVLRVLIAAGVLFLLALFTQSHWTGGFAESAAARVRATQNPDQQRAIAQMAGTFLARDLVQLSVLALVLAGAVFAFVVGRRTGALFLASALLLIGVVDYYRVDRYILHPHRFLNHDAYRVIRAPAETDRFMQSDAMMDFLRAQEEPFRIFPMDSPQRPFGALYASNRFMIFGVESIGGYHPAKLALYEEYLRAMGDGMANGNFALLDMLNVRYIVAGERLPDIPRFRGVWTGVDYEQQPRAIYENLGAFPRAWIAGAYRVVPRAEIAGLLASGSVDVRHEVVLESRPALEPAPGDSAAVTLVRRGPREIVFAVTLDRPGILVASEMYYPDWKAEVNGKPADVMRANLALRAVALPAGTHEVAFRYDASLLRQSATISVAAFVTTLLALVAGLFATRKGLPWKRSS